MPNNHKQALEELPKEQAERRSKHKRATDHLHMTSLSRTPKSQDIRLDNRTKGLCSPKHKKAQTTTKDPPKHTEPLKQNVSGECRVPEMS
jgi:hypothetical protein